MRSTETEVKLVWFSPQDKYLHDRKFYFMFLLIIFIEFINKTGIFHVIYNTMNNVETVLFVDITSAYVKTPVII